jgi:hypothetical protein
LSSEYYSSLPLNFGKMVSLTLLFHQATELRGTLMIAELIDSAQLWLTGLALGKLKELSEATEEPAFSARELVLKRAMSKESELTKRFFSWKYECLKPDAILELQEHEISYVATQLECDEDLAVRLLRHFKWSAQAVLEEYGTNTSTLVMNH